MGAAINLDKWFHMDGLCQELSPPQINSLLICHIEMYKMYKYIQ